MPATKKEGRLQKMKQETLGHIIFTVKRRSIYLESQQQGEHDS